MRRRLCLYALLAACGAAGCSSTREAPPTVTGSTPTHSRFAKKAFNRPYEIKGITYKPKAHYEHVEEGIASYYGGGDVFHGRKTSTGQVFDMHEISAAHKHLPLPCIVRVTNLENGRTLKVPVVDRGPFVDDRVIDLSRKAAQLLGFHNKGLAKVRVETLVEESLMYAQNYSASEGHTLFADNHAGDVKKIDLASLLHTKPAEQTMVAEAKKRDEQPAVAASATAGLGAAGIAARGLAHEGVYAATKAQNVAAKPPVPETTYIRAVSPHLQHQKPSRPEVHAVSAVPLTNTRQPIGQIAVHQAALNTPELAHVGNPMQQLLAEAKPVVLTSAQPGQLPPIPPQYLVQHLKGTFVQAGTYAHLDQARQVLFALQKVAPRTPVRLQLLEARGRYLYRIYVGPVQSSQESNHLLSVMSRNGYPHVSVVRH